MPSTNRTNRTNPTTPAPITLVEAEARASHMKDWALEHLTETVNKACAARKELNDRMLGMEPIERIARWNIADAVKTERAGELARNLMATFAGAKPTTLEAYLAITKEWMAELTRTCLNEARSGQNCTCEWTNATERAKLQGSLQTLDDFKCSVAHNLEMGIKMVNEAKAREAAAH